MSTHQYNSLPVCQRYMHMYDNCVLPHFFKMYSQFAYIHFAFAVTSVQIYLNSCCMYQIVVVTSLSSQNKLQLPQKTNGSHRKYKSYLYIKRYITRSYRSSQAASNAIFVT